MSDQFQPGDVVQLKSGGPLMTVDKFHKDSGKYRCEWFSGTENKSDLFSGSSLNIYHEPETESW